MSSDNYTNPTAETPKYDFSLSGDQKDFLGGCLIVVGGATLTWVSVAISYKLTKNLIKNSVKEALKDVVVNVRIDV